jgi:hypothetical protein
MAFTLNKIVYDLWETVRNAHIVDDDNIDKRLIEHWVKQNRVVWIKNELNKNRPISNRFIQDLGLIDLEWVDSSLAGLSTDYHVLRTNVNIPNTIEHLNEPTITRIGPALIDRARYSVVPYERIPYIGNGRFNKTSIFAFWLNNRLYLASKENSLLYSGMKQINVRAILADPEEAITFHFADGTPCYSATSDFPITEPLVVYMKDMILKSDFLMLLQSKPDETNNAADDTSRQTQ